MGPAIAGVAVGGAIAQWMVSEEARKASDAERKKMERLLAKIQDPNFDPRSLTPLDYEVVGKYVPEVASYVEEINPTVVRADSEGARTGRDAQMRALSKFRQLGETGDDVESKLLRTQALRDAQIQNQGQQASIQQNMAQRGQSGSGLELISALMAQQGAAQNASSTAQQAARDAYNRRLDAMRTSAQMGSDIRNEDVALESKNADIINSYNQRFADARNAYNRYAAGTRNEGQRYNLDNEQDIANRNVGQYNEFQVRNQDRDDNNKQQGYTNALSKYGMHADNSRGAQQAITQQGQQKSNMISGLQGGAYQGMDYYQGRQDRAEDREDRAKYGYR